MREVKGDIWDYPCDAICITTNGDINAQGLAVMGRGIALQAAKRLPGMRKALAESLREHGNVVNCWDPYLLGLAQPQLLDDGEPIPTHPYVVTFPVKEHWKDPARLSLIRRSAVKLVLMTDEMQWKTVALPRPGCGAGELAWDVVRPALLDIFGDDDRFVIVDVVS